MDVFDDALRHTAGHVSKVTGERLDRGAEGLRQVCPEVGHPGNRLVARDVEVASRGAPVPLGDVEHAPVFAHLHRRDEAFVLVLAGGRRNGVWRSDLHACTDQEK